MPSPVFWLQVGPAENTQREVREIGLLLRDPLLLSLKLWEIVALSQTLGF